MKWTLEILLGWLMVYVIGLSATVGSVCYFDVVRCGHTGDTREWIMQILAVIVSLIAGGRIKDDSNKRPPDSQ